LNRNEEIIERILTHYERSWHPGATDPFKGLVRTILSQNTNNRNQTTAYNRLEERIGITPENIAHADIEAVREAIRPAGMYNQRSRILKHVAETIIQRFGGNLTSVMEKPYPEARSDLMSLPGVGPKTADVVLLFVGGREIVPVDRHIFRISRRLQIAPEKASYDDVRHAIEVVTPTGRHEDVHILLIQLGREICRAQNPRCRECFLSDVCTYPGKKG
jgi:endonuclease-3